MRSMQNLLRYLFHEESLKAANITVLFIIEKHSNIMKRYLLTFFIALFSFTAKAISYEEASRQAWFLTDKMAYELNLTAEQCDRAYQINLDYLMNLRSPSDCVGSYWYYRDADLRCILFDWQYNLMRTLDYFFRPVRYHQSRWYYPVFDHYRYGYYFFERPLVCINYRGGMWRRRGHSDPSPYLSMRPQRGFGMRDQYKNRQWLGNNKNPEHRPSFSRPGGKPGKGDITPVTGGRPSASGGTNKGWRPDTGRGNSSHSSTDGRPTAPNNARPNNRDNNQQPAFRDPYTNYRQTGNSVPSTGRGGTRGSGGTVLNSANRGGTFTPNTQRQQPRQSGRSNTSTSNRGGGRTFGTR